ncbi:MAG: hypothetical protein MI861_03390 [Pirellulales bacterium]|nr:hypothetical protein [Pirellulales bacterium]
MNRRPTVPHPRWFWGLALVLVTTTAAIACQVPVFRYALERWAADRYEVVILHQGPLSESERVRISKLRRSNHQSPISANFEIVSADVKEIDYEAMRNLWKKHRTRDNHQPLMVTLYPRNAQEVPDRVASVSEFTDQATSRLIDSPVRQEIVKRLVDGDSAVWIFVPSGNVNEDAAALERLTKEVEKNQKQLKLPPQEEIEADEFLSEETKIELRLSFSIVTLQRDDPKERFLLDLLLESEPDLRSLDQPMAFPVLGRGRVLYALVGRGIFEDTIAMASTFIVGPCSCQVKEQNPGFDLLMAVDWDEKVGVKTLSKPPRDRSSEPELLVIPPGSKKK